MAHRQRGLRDPDIVEAAPTDAYAAMARDATAPMAATRQARHELKAALCIPSTRGMGHVVRCRTLANELVERGWTVQTSGAKRPAGFVGGVVIVDGDDMPPETYDWPCPVVAIRDTFAALPWHVPHPTLMVVPSAGLRPASYAHLYGVLSGPTYSLLRPEFREWAQRRDDAGWGFCGNVFDARTVAVEHTMSANEIGEHLATASVVITYAGMRAMEAACVGVPMVLIPRNEGEVMNANGLENAHAAKVVTEEWDAMPMADRLMRDPRKLGAMGRAGRALVDGFGCQRVADAIEKEVGQ